MDENNDQGKDMYTKAQYKIIIGELGKTEGKEYKTMAKTKAGAIKAMMRILGRFEYGGWGRILELTSSGDYIIVADQAIII